MYHDGAGCKKHLCNCGITGRFLRGEESEPWYGGGRLRSILIMNAIIWSVLFLANILYEPEENARVEGDKLVWAGKHEQALPYFNKILERDPNNLYALSKKCDILRFLNIYQEALICYEGALAMYPNSFVLQDGKKDTNKLLAQRIINSDDVN